MPQTLWSSRQDLLPDFDRWDFVKFVLGSIALAAAVIAMWLGLLMLDALNDPINKSWPAELVILTQHLAGALALYLFAARKSAVGWRGIGFRATNPTQIGQSLLLALITAAFTIVAVEVLPLEIPLLYEADPTDARTAILMIVTGTVTAPLVEESLFRGILFGFVRRSFSFAIAATLSSVVFGLLHGLSVNTVYAALFGVVAAAIYERTSSLWPSVAFHMTYNALFLVGFFMPAFS
jgi:uncharacterized protein